MNTVIDLFKQGLLLVALLSVPALAIAVITGILVSIFQTLFSIQDQSLSFAVKLFSVGLALLATGRWCASEVLQLADECFLIVASLTVRS